MTEAWKQWEGRVVSGEFALRQYLGGSDHSAVFRTERGQDQPAKAAIKLVPADHNAERQLARWRQAASLSHPHLLRLFEMGRTQLDNLELLYVVMECAEEDLAQVLPERPLTPAEARDMLGQVLKALAHVHGRGLVHGAIKPANILAVDERVKISSDSLRPEGEPDRASAAPGAYDPPEAVPGRAGDIWALGVTLVKVMTQQLPVWDEAQADPGPPGPLPAPFDDIARDCLRREPQRRASIADIVVRLQPVPQPRATPTPAQPRAQPAPPQPWAAWAKPRYLIPAAAVALVLVAVVVGSKVFTGRPSLSDPTTSPVEQPAPAKQSPARTLAPAQSPARSAALTGQPVSGEIVHRVLPRVSRTALETVRGTVRVGVRVEVDPAGNVTDAEFDSSGPSRYFASRSLEAAQGWKFKPPTVDGRAVPSAWLLRFEFTNTEVRAVPQRVAPQ